VKERRSKREKAEAISKLVTDVNRLKETREFGRAFEVLNQGLREHPGDPTLVREFESLRTARAIWLRQQAVGEILARVQQLKSEIRFADASKLLVESLKEYRDEPVLLDAQQQLEKEWSAHKRRDDIAKSAADAASMLASGQLKEAVQFLRAACEKYPDELEIQALFVRATEALREQGRSEAVSKVEQQANALADRHEFEAALQLLEVELKKWPGEKRLLSAQARIQGQEKTEQYQKVLRQADALIGRGQFKEALRNLDAALEQYAGDAALGQLRERAKREQELQERAEAVAAALTQIKALTDQARLDEALQLAREYCRKYPGDAALESALDRVQQELRAIKQRQQAERECETLMGEGRFQEAINLLQAAVASFPSDPTLGVLLSKARSELEAGNRAATIAKLVADARTLATGHNYDGAMALLLRGLSSWPSERSLLDAQQEIRSAQASWRLEQAVREKLRSIKRLERDGRFAEALRILEETLQRYPDQTALLELRPQLLKAKCLREAGELLERGQFSGALNLLAPMVSQFPSDPELAELVDRAKQGVRAGEKAAAIEKLCSEARVRAEAHDFESALAALNDALKTWPNESAILETERSIIHLRERWLHQQAVSEAVLQVEQLERENRLDEALECITKSIEDLGSDSAFVQAKERYEAKLQDREWKRRRQSHIEKLSTLDQAASEVSGPSEARQMLEHAHRILEYYPDDQEVRSAGEVSVRHLSDIIRAAGELANRNFAAVLEICDKYLKRFPSHVLCTELRTEARNCVRVDYINQLQRTVSAEPDFESRKRLLQEGFARYPGDPWITEELRLTLKQLSRVGSLVDKAKAHEAAGEWDRAVDQWKGVLSIYAQYPGIQAAIARAEEQIRRTRDTAVSGWVEQINRQVEAGDLDEAAKQFDRALVEFPEERAILDAGIRLEGLKGRRNQLRELLSEGEAALKNGRYEDGTTKLQQAAQLDNTGATLHKVLNLLLKFARKAAPVDWRAAEQMGGAIVTLNPKAALPDDLSRAIATARTDETVRDCLLRAGELRMKGQLAAAYAEVDRALAICPDERRLKQLQHSLSEQIRAARQPLIDELRAIEASAQTAANPAEIGEMLARARARREQYGNDPEVIALVDAAERALNARKRQLLVARFASYRGVGGAIATGAIVLVLAILGWRHFSQVQGPTLEPVEVTSTPSGAEIKVEDQTCASPPCHFRLSRGDHPLTAQLEGYRPVSRTIHVDPAKSTPVHILLEPFGAVLLVTTNFRSGHVMLNGARAGDLQNGSFERKDLLTGKYKLVISGSEGDASLSFETAPGRLPTIQGRVEAKDADALVVSNMGHSAKLDCNCTSGEVLLDGKRLGNLGAQGLDLRDLSEGNKKLNVRERDVNINIGPEPSINVILTSARNVGTLSVETNVDSATVIVDKKRYPGASAGKSIQLQLDVGNYLVEVQKDGYSGARQSAQITRGSRLQRTFTLVPLNARLDIQGGRAGTRVSIDGRQVGAVQSDGRFSTDVGPGEHAILLELQGFHSKSSRHNFEPGKSWSILPAEALLGVDEKVVEAKRRADEDNVWNGVRKDSRAALQQFVEQYPNGARAGEAKGLIEGLDRKLAEQRKLDEQRRLDEQAAEKKKGDEEKEKKKAEDTRQQQIELARRQTEQRKAEEDAIRLAVGKYETAYQKEDLNGLKAIYPTLQKSAESTIKNNFTYFARFQYTLKPGAPEIQGDTASVQCSRSLTGRTKDGQSLAQNDTVVVRLEKDRDHWLIVSMDTTR
jgi:ketosteroid isomerase-like protein